jgi:hypothetical protein
MKPKYTSLLSLAALCLVLTACQSPTATMHPQQVSQLSNQQLCNLKNSYPWEQNLELELGKRGLNCDPDFNECRNRGIDTSSPAMASCINDIREKRQLQREMQQQQMQMQQQQRAAETARQNELWRLQMENRRLQHQQTAPKICTGLFCM